MALSTSAAGASQASNHSDDDTRAGTLAPKNRACPFCNQLFTSSSLGRHLDLYIKDKNPKAPDGIHDVGQIRKIRSQITRRHARSSTGRRNGSERALSTASGSDGPDSSSKHDTPHLAAPLSQTPTSAVSRLAQTATSNQPHHPQPPPARAGSLDVHKLKWQATGVINDLPPRHTDSPRLDIFRDPEHRQRYLEERDNGRAAEMALREVLNEIQAAQLRLRNRPLFPDFDFFACNFPSLCFKLLPPPPTLYSTTPMPSPDTWPINGLPTQETFRAVKEVLDTKTHSYHRLHQTPTSSPPAGSPPATREETQRYTDHLERVWSQWSALVATDPKAGEKWNLELLRAAADERRLRQESSSALEAAQAEADHLRTQLTEQAASIAADPSRPGTERGLWYKIQRPSAAALIGPGVPAHVPSPLAQRLDSATNWDFHTLVTKWRETLRSGAPPPAYPPLSHHSPTGSGAAANETQPSHNANGSGVAHMQGSALDHLSFDHIKGGNTTQPNSIAGSSIPSKRGIGDTGVTDHYQHYHVRQAPAMRDAFASNGSLANGGRASPTVRER